MYISESEWALVCLRGRGPESMEASYQQVR